MDERDALAQLKQGNIKGLEDLVRLHQDKALRVAQLITRDSTLAQDVVQDAFVRAYERIAQYDTMRPFAPWFFRIVANLSLQAIKKQKRFTGFNPLATTPEKFNVEALIEQAEDEQQIETALNSLPPEQRTVFVLRFYVGLSEAETADRTAAPLGTVKWRLHRARERLKILLTAMNVVDGKP